MSDLSDCVLLTIRPEHAAKIYSGEKRAELRKTFPSSAKLVFLYETDPVRAITGAFTVHHAFSATVTEAVTIAASAGVDRRRAVEYYGNRQNGWIVHVGLTARFGSPFTLQAIRRLDHYFSVPRTFSYLRRAEGLTQELLQAFVEATAPRITLAPLASEHQADFVQLVKSEVGTAYDDIDDDFLCQLLDRRSGEKAAFSTRRKHVLQAQLDREIVGFTVLTEKVHGAWKSGPSAVLLPFRGSGVGQALRQAIRHYCMERNARAIYCTCADSRPAVVSYLLASGMKFQARLVKHLSPERDELVFLEQLHNPRQAKPSTPRVRAGPREHISVKQVGPRDHEARRLVRFFVQHLADWYFKPPATLENAIVKSLVDQPALEARYSAKARMLYALQPLRGKPRAALLLTLKRSRMVKMNLVATTRDPRSLLKLLKKAIGDNLQFRRFYLTVPSTELTVIHTLNNLGFAFEGILADPFGTGHDHCCLGATNHWLRRRL